jgi:outer membrane protein assembly factor BamB
MRRIASRSVLAVLLAGCSSSNLEANGPDASGLASDDAGWPDVGLPQPEATPGPDPSEVGSSEPPIVDAGPRFAPPAPGTRSAAPRTAAGAHDWPQSGLTAANVGASTARVASAPTSAWSVMLPTMVAYATTLVANDRVFAMMYGTFAAYDAHTGAQLWVNASLKGGKYGTPAVAGGVLVAPAASSASGSNAWTVVGLDAATGVLRWQSAGASALGAIRISGDVAYGTGDATFALDVATGATKWSAQLGCTTAPAIDAGSLYCAGPSGLVVADAATGAVRLRSPAPGAHAVSTPAVADGRVFLVGASLLAYDSSDGTPLWSAPFSTPDLVVNGGTLIETSPAVADGRVFVIGSQGLQAFDAATGKSLWGVGVGTPGTSVAVSDGLVLVGADYLLDAATGGLVWQSGESPRTTSPALVDGWFYALDMEGQRLRAFSGAIAGAM